MSRNRFRSTHWIAVRKTISRLTDNTLDVLVYLRPVLKAALVLSCLGGLSWGLLAAAKKSPYFNISSVRVENTERVTRDDVMAALNLSNQGNYFVFDELAARARLLRHDWGADAAVIKHLPNRLNVRIQERKAVAVVVLEELYLVDAEGKVFAHAHDLETLPHLLITGLNKSLLREEPETFKRRVRLGLSMGRMYEESDASSHRKLDSVHFGESGRWELMLGSTHVILGADRIEDRLAYLADVLRTLGERKVDAEYIMLAPELNRAIVKETALSQRATELSLRTKSNGREAR